VLGWRIGTFEQAYHLTRQSLHDDVIENHVVMGSLVRYLTNYQLAGECKEHSEVLLAKLTAQETDDAVTRSQMWPKSAAMFGRTLKNCAPALRKQFGWDVEQTRDMTHRYWKFTYKPVSTAAIVRPEPTDAVKAVAARLTQPKESLGQSVRRVRKGKTRP
jgi:hypothetical protein